MKQRKKGYLFLLIILETFSAGLLPLLTISIPQRVIDTMMESNDISSALKNIVCLFALLLFLNIISMLCNSRFDSDFVELRMAELSDLHKKYQTLDYHHLEDSDFADKAKSAMRALSSPTGFEDVYRNFIKICPCLVTIFAYIGLMYSFMPVIALICVLTTVISFFFHYKISDYIESKKNDLAYAEKQKDYFRNISYQSTCAKDIRIFHLAEKLMGDYEKKSRSFLDMIYKIADEEWKLGAKGLISILLKDSFVYFSLLKVTGMEI